MGWGSNPIQGLLTSFFWSFQPHDIHPRVLCTLQLLWNYKLNLTTDPKFESVAVEVCKTTISEVSAETVFKLCRKKMVKYLHGFFSYLLMSMFYTLSPRLLAQIKECAAEELGKGYLVSCLVDHRGNISDYQCNQYITKMTTIVFSDYRLICGFMDKCREDINTLRCGSISTGEKVGLPQVTVVTPFGTIGVQRSFVN